MKSPRPEIRVHPVRRGSEPRVLLVDDNEGSLMALEFLLEGIDVVPVRARSAEEAFKHLLDGDFALLVLDVRLPDTDGFEVARLLRLQPRHKDIPIIFVTALDRRPQDMEQAYALGAVDFLSKPVRPEAFRSKVRIFIELYRGRRELERRVSERTAELEAASARLRLFAEQSPAVQWMTDADLRITLSVGAGLASLGLKPGQLVGLRVVDYVAPQDPAVDAHQRALRGESASYEGIYSGRQIESYLEPLRDSGGKVVGVVGVGFDRTEKRSAEQTIRLVGEVGRKLSSELDLEKLVQATTDVATELVGAQFGAFFYNVTNEKGDSYLLYALSGASREEFQKFPMPRNTSVFSPTFRGEGVVRSEDIRKDPRYGKNAPHHGMPRGHLPVVSYLAVPVISRSGEVLGGLFFGHGEPGRFTEGHERLVTGIAAYAAVAIENAQLYRRAQDALAERKRAEEAKYRLASIVESTDDAIASKTLEGIVTSWNTGAERLFGYGADEMIGCPITKIIPEDRLSEEADILSKLVRGERVDHFETVRKRKDGSFVDVSLSISPLRDGSGKIVGASKIARDIGARKRAETALRESRAELERELADVQLLQKVGAEMIREEDGHALFEGIMDAATRIMRSQYASIQMLSDRGNGKELRLLAFRGFSPQAARFWEYVRPGSGSTCGVALREGRRVTAPDVARCDFMAGTEDLGTYLRTGIRAVQTTPLFSRDGALVGMISTHWREPHEPSERDLRLFDILARQAADLIERRAAEEKLRTLNAELDDRVRERTRALRETITELDSFAYTVAHDLRAPLRSIHNFGEMLLEEAAPNLGPVERGYLESMVRAGGRMDALITDLLSYTRIHRQDVALERTDLEAVVGRVLEDLEAELSARNAEVTVSKPLPEVTGHGLLLTQALANLISNAVKFVAPGTNPRVRISAQREGRRVRVWVEDNGIGIAPEHHPKLFKVFERIDPAKGYPGTGIGLAIVRRAAERMGGAVGIDSAVGRGSRFWIELRLPVARGHEA